MSVQRIERNKKKKKNGEKVFKWAKILEFTVNAGGSIPIWFVSEFEFVNAKSLLPEMNKNRIYSRSFYPLIRRLFVFMSFSLQTWSFFLHRFALNSIQTHCCRVLRFAKQIKWSKRAWNTNIKLCILKEKSIHVHRNHSFLCIEFDWVIYRDLKTFSLCFYLAVFLCSIKK